MPTLAALAEMLDHQDVGEALTALVNFLVILEIAILNIYIW